MIWTIVALVMTVIMGGIIAYYGDLIGRKFGKRRVSVMGLRPKHTAILITSLSGVAISAVTTGVLFLVVPPVRDVILDGEEAILRVPILQRQEKEQRAQVAALTLQTGDQRARLGVVERANQGARRDLAAEKARVAQVQAERAALEARYREEKASVAAQVARLVATKQSLESARRGLEAHNAALLAQNSGLTKSNAALIAANNGLKEENRRRLAMNDDLAKQNADFATQNENLTRECGRLTKQREALTGEVDSRQKVCEHFRVLNDMLAADNEKLSTTNADLKARNALLMQTVERITPGYKDLSEAYLAARNRRVVIHKDDDLARLVVPAKSSPEQVRDCIQQLLHNASQEAVQRGAGRGERTRAVQVVDREFVIRTSDGAEKGVEVSASERVDATVSKLSWQPVDTCVLAIAVANSVEQEPAAVDLVSVANRPLFRKGQEVASRRFNSGEPIPRLFDDVVAFLKETGQEALHRGLIPRIDPTGEPQVGSLDAAEIAGLVERIREHTGYVRIKALAADQIASADRLSLKFRIEP